MTTYAEILATLREDYIAECRLDIIDPKRAAQIRAGVDEHLERKLEPVAKEEQTK